MSTSYSEPHNTNKSTVPYTLKDTLSINICLFSGFPEGKRQLFNTIINHLLLLDRVNEIVSPCVQSYSLGNPFLG